MRLASLTHIQPINVATPGLILILVDQSKSMDQPYANTAPNTRTRTKADVAAAAVNRVLFEIQKASQSGRQIRRRCFVGVITYGESVRPAVGGWISDVAENASGSFTEVVRIPDGRGNTHEVLEEIPIWVAPAAENGTPMDLAFEDAYPLAKDWADEHMDCFPPVVINISDGAPNDLQNDGDGSRTVAAAQKLMSISSNDGGLLLFNAHVAHESNSEISLPTSRPDLSDPFAGFLFDISSQIPDTMFARAGKAGFDPTPGARGMVFNATPNTLVRLLNFGSSQMLQ